MRRNHASVYPITQDGKPTEAKAGKGARTVRHDSVSRQWKSIKINDESDPKYTILKDEKI